MSMSFGFGLMRKIEKLEPELKEVFLEFGEEIEKNREETVGRGEFGELRYIVKELAEAQKRTELRVEELAEAQKRTELRVEELAEAQKRTELRVEELAEAQKRTELRIEELAVAVKELAAALNKLTDEFGVEVKLHRKTREQLGGLSMSFGYTLENEAYKKLPGLLEKDFGITAEERLIRRYVNDIDGNDIEVNIFGNGERNVNGEVERVTIIGESKAQLSKNDVDNFLRRKIKRLEGLYPGLFMVLITHMTTGSDVEEYAKQKQIALYYSYDF
ncbi:MAG: chordopoxvirus fusion protein [Candidatus Aminicenantes bacterium]|nr:chordopoxvirus fusion protein [Candidatus Aminicenantes bacterium]